MNIFNDYYHKRLILLIILFTIIGCSSSFTPEESLENLKGIIYFNSNRTGDQEIYKMNPDGTDIVNLTHSPSTQDELCAVSPDGEKIAFMRCNPYDWDSYEIWIMDNDGGNKKRLTFNAKADGHNDFSPDGKKIVFASWRDGNDEIYTMNIDGSDQKRLTNNQVPDNDPDWSPDGNYIAFKSTRDHSNTYSSVMLDNDYEIYIMDTTGNNIVRLTNDRYSDHDPDWSPDGNKIAFLRYIEGEGADVWMMDRDGSNQMNLSNSGNSWYTSWSNDGMKLIFCTNRTESVDIFIMNVNGDNQIRITYGLFNDEYPAWSN